MKPKNKIDVLPTEDERTKSIFVKYIDGRYEIIQGRKLDSSRPGFDRKAERIDFWVYCDDIETAFDNQKK